MKENLGFRPEVDRMKGLLVDAITTLCRNGLRYKAGLRVEGLIGITLDEEDIILVNVNKTFIAEGCGNTPSKASSDEESTNQELDPSPKKSNNVSKSSRGIKRETQSSPQSYSVTKKLKQSVASESTGSDPEEVSAEVEPGEVTQARIRIENSSWVPQQSPQNDQHAQGNQACFPQAVTIHTEEGSESVPVKIELSDEEDNENDELSNFGATLLQNFSHPGSTMLTSQPFDPQNTSDVLFTQPSPGGSQSLPGLSSSSSDEMHLQGSATFQMAGIPRSLSQKVKSKQRSRSMKGGTSSNFQCPFCPASFGERKHYGRHLETVHSTDKFRCPFCSHCANRKDNLRKHVATQHPSLYHDFDPKKMHKESVQYQEYAPAYETMEADPMDPQLLMTKSCASQHDVELNQE